MKAERTVTHKTRRAELDAVAHMRSPVLVAFVHVEIETKVSCRCPFTPAVVLVLPEPAHLAPPVLFLELKRAVCAMVLAFTP